MAAVNVLLVGAGVMGSYHARVIHQSERTKLAGVVDPFEASGRPLAEKHQTTWFPELPDLSPFDAVVVAAPTEIHYEIALRVLENSTPLLVEKPLTNNLGATVELINLSRQKDTPLMCGFLERFNPAVITARQFIESPIHLTTVRHSPYAPRIRTGVAWDLLVHDVDLVSQLMGQEKLANISGALGVHHPQSEQGAEDIAEAILTFSNGAVAQSSASRVGHKKVRSLVVTELDKLTEVDLLRKDVTVYRNVSNQMIEEVSRGYRQQTVIDIPEIITSQEPLAAQLNHFVDIVQGIADADKERESLLPAHEIIDVLKSTSQLE
jgi:predicted dehydrogenase